MTAENKYLLDDDGALDDVVVHDVEMFRLERMDGNAWWACCHLRDGSTVHFSIAAKKARVDATHRIDPARSEP